jgi:hypothetical protein
MQVKTCDVVYDDSIRCRMLDLRCRTNIRPRMAAMSYVLRHRRGTMSYVHDVRHRVQHRYYTMSYVWRTTSYVGKNPDGTGITRQESYRKCYITSFNLLLQKRTSEQFHGKEGFYTASLRFSLFWTASLRICSESLWNSQESYPNWFQQFQRSEALHSV